MPKINNVLFKLEGFQYATLETHELWMHILKNGRSEELIALLENFNKSVNGNRTNTVSGWINYLRIFLRREALQEIEELAGQNNGTDNAHLKAIKEGLLM